MEQEPPGSSQPGAPGVPLSEYDSHRRPAAQQEKARCFPGLH